MHQGQTVSIRLPKHYLKAQRLFLPPENSKPRIRERSTRHICEWRLGMGRVKLLGLLCHRPLKRNHLLDPKGLEGSDSCMSPRRMSMLVFNI